MKQQFQHCFRWIALLLVSVLIGTGCTGPSVIEPASTPVSTPSPGVVVTPTSVPTSTPEAVITPTLVPSPAREPEAHEDVLYADVFKDPTSGWPNEIAFDNYYIGYHEPEWYHVEVHEQNDSEVVVLPGRTFDNFTVESEILVSGANTAPDGDFRYGLAVRRSGNRFYAFTISPRTKNWYVFKSSPTGLEVLDEGADDSIQGLTDLDTLRVDARGPALTFHINGQPVSQVSDSDYADGALGFFVETFDSPRAHIHYDSLTIRGVEVLSLPPQDVLYADEFKDPTSGWLNELAFDNYYIGYHEPEWYHVEVHERGDRAVVVLPGQSFDDFTVETETFVSGANTAPDGDFRYGLAVRRSGNRFYAFTISPRTKNWYVFKSSPTGLEVLDEGADDSIQGLTDLDTLRVDARGPALTFHINGQPVSQVSDSDYADGALGFFVETFHSPRAHIHYDSLTIRKAAEVIPTLSRPISKATTPTSTAPARTRTPVPLRRATPPAPPAVVLLAPVDGARLHGRVTFRWGWAGTPGPGETFDVRVCKSQECAPEFGKTNTAEPTWIWQPDQGVGTYRWQVVVIRWEEDRVVAEQAHSPVWRFEWTGGGEEKRPEPTPTPPPYP